MDSPDLSSHPADLSKFSSPQIIFVQKLSELSRRCSLSEEGAQDPIHTATQPRAPDLFPGHCDLLFPLETFSTGAIHFPRLPVMFCY